MDDRAAITALLHVARQLSEQGDPPAGDVSLEFTTNGEIGGIGGAYASRTLPGDLTIALEVGPAEAEYATTCSGDPVSAYSDAECVYDKQVADSLMAIATERGLSPQSSGTRCVESMRRTPRPPHRHSCSCGRTSRSQLAKRPSMSGPICWTPRSVPTSTPT
jgi:putative aminopeptidase FrvX